MFFLNNSKEVVANIKALSVYCKTLKNNKIKISKSQFSQKIKTLKEQTTGKSDFVIKLHLFIDILAKDTQSMGKKILSEISNNFKIVIISKEEMAKIRSKTAKGCFYPKLKSIFINEDYVNIITLKHELLHAYQYEKGPLKRSTFNSDCKILQKCELEANLNDAETNFKQSLKGDILDDYGLVFDSIYKQELKQAEKLNILPNYRHFFAIDKTHSKFMKILRTADDTNL